MLAPKDIRIDNHLTPKSPCLLILGGGAVVSEYYIPALYALKYADKAVIVDASVVSLKALQKRHPQITVRQADFRNFLDDISGQEKFDAAVVALPNSLHEEATVKALNCGLHILCEKPLALTSSACLRMAAEADIVNRVLAVGMVRRLLPSVSSMRKALTRGLIGDIVSIDIEDGVPYPWLSDTGDFFRPENGGVLADMGVHYLDIVEHLIGKLIPIEYQDDSAGGVETNLEFHLKTESGIPVRLALSRTHLLRNTAVFRGKRGELILEKGTFDVCLWKPHNSTLSARLESIRPFTSGNWPLRFESCFVEQFFRFTCSIQGFSIEYVSAREAASVIGLIDWAYKHRSPDKGKYIMIKETSKQPRLSRGSVVVTGGTGFIGSRLVERLHGLGFDQITVPVRNYRTCAEVARFPVAMPRINLLNYRQVKSVVNGARYVFHLAYGRDGTRAHRARVTVEGTRNVVEAAIEAGVESIVVLSTMYVFGHPDTKARVDEKWPYAPTGGEYGQSKARMERYCLKRAHSSKSTRIAVLNPTCVYGPGGKAYTEMPVQMAKENKFCWVEDGRGIANYTFIGNLLDVMLLAAGCPEAHGERFIINDDSVTWRNFLTPLLGPYAQKVPTYTKNQLQALQYQIPRPSLFDVLRVLAQIPVFGNVVQLAKEWVPGLVQKARRLNNSLCFIPAPSDAAPSIPPLWLADLFGPTTTVFSSEKAQRILGWQPRFSLEEGQEITVEWLRSVNLLNKNL